MFNTFYSSYPHMPVCYNAKSTYQETLSHTTNNARKTIRLHVPTTAYSHVLVYPVSGLWQRGMNETVQASKRQQYNSNPYLLDWDSDVTSIHCATTYSSNRVIVTNKTEFELPTTGVGKSNSAQMMAPSGWVAIGASSLGLERRSLQIQILFRFVAHNDYRAAI